MNYKPILSAALLGLALPAQADLLHHYTFDADATDSGTAGVGLVLGGAASITNDCYRVGTGALRLDASLSNDTRPATVPTGVPSVGSDVNGWDGASSHTNIDPSAFANGDVRTMAAWLWIDPDGLEANSTILVIGTTPNLTRHNLRLQNAGGNWFLRSEIQTSYALVDSAQMSAKIPGLTNLADGQWHHIAVTLPNTISVIEDTTLWIDGVSFTGGELSLGTQGLEFDTGIGPIHVGDGINDANRDFDGYVDDVRIYDEELDSTAINALVSAPGGSILCEFEADTTSTFAGQAVTLEWDVFAFDTLEIDNGIGDVSGSTTNGNGSITVYPVATTTYTLTGMSGGSSQTLQVTIDVETDPPLAIAVAPPYADGSVPVEICWNTPLILGGALAGTVDSLTSGGTLVTDSGADFTTDFAGASGALLFEIDTPFFLDTTAQVSSFTMTELTLATAVGTTFDTSLAVLPNQTSGNNERSYEAYDTAAQATLDALIPAEVGQRWANSANPTFTGGNGAAQFEDQTGTIMTKTLEVVSDAAVPVITHAYRFGDAIGKARAWWSNPGCHESFAVDDTSIEVWFKPDGLANGDQILVEFGGNGKGTYVAMKDDKVVVRSKGNTGVSVAHTLTDTNWHQAVAIFHVTNDTTADDFLELYIDGNLVATSALVNLGVYTGSDDAGFGGAEGSYCAPDTDPDALTAAVADVHFEGLIARLAFYDRAFSAGEVQQNYLAITQDAIAAQGFVGGAGYSVKESLGAQTITVDDDDPSTASPLYTTSNPAEVQNGCFTTTAAVTTTTTYTVTATAPSGASMDTGTVTVGGSGTTYEEIVLADGPLAYYRFEEAAGTAATYDSSGNGYHSTIFTGNLDPAQTGPIGRALGLNGNHVIEVSLNFNPQDPDGDDTAGDVDPDGVEGFTIEALVYDDLSINTGNRTIAAQRDLNGTGRVGLEVDGPAESLRSYLGGGPLISPNQRLGASWSHYAIVCEYIPGTTDYTVTFYNDGQFDETFTGILVEACEGNWVLGIQKSETGDWIGLFDEIAFYDTALSQTQLQTHVDAFVAQSQIGILAFVDDSIISLGDSVDLIAKVGGSVAGSVDNGGGTANPGTTTVTVSPTTTTDYTLTVGAEMKTVSVTVLGPVRVIDTGIDGSDQFFMTVENLRPDTQYELYYSTDLVTAFAPTGIVQQGTGANPVTFIDNAVPVTGVPKTFYQIFEVAP